MNDDRQPEDSFFKRIHISPWRIAGIAITLIGLATAWLRNQSIQKSLDQIYATSTPGVSLPAGAPADVQGEDPLFRVYINDLKEIKRIGDGVITRVVQSPDGKYLAVGTTQGVYIYNLDALERALSIKSDIWVNWLAYTPDGATLLVSDNTSLVRAYRAEDGNFIKQFEVIDSSVASIAGDPGGERFAVGTDDGRVLFFALADDVAQETLTVGEDIVTVIAYNPDGSLIAVGTRGSGVYVYSSSDKSKQAHFGGEDADIACLEFSPDGSQIVYATTAGNLAAWDVEAQAEQTLANLQESSRNNFHYSPDGSTIVFSSRGTLTTLQLAEGVPVEQYSVAPFDFLWIDFSSDGSQLIAAVTDGTIRIWSLENGELANEINDFSTSINAVAVTPDGSLVVSGDSSGRVALYTIPDGTLVRTMEGHHSYVTSVAINFDGTLVASSSDDGTIKIWNLENGEQLLSIESPNGLRIVLYSNPIIIS